MENELNIYDMNLIVLSSSTFDGYEGKFTGKMQTRVVYEYELEYFTKSDGGIIVDGEMIHFSKGDINFRRPGQVVSGVAPYSCINMCFDVTGNKEKLNSFSGFGSSNTSQKNYHNSILDAVQSKIKADYCKGIDVLIRKIYQNYTAQNDISKLEMRADLYRIIIELYKASDPNNSKNNAYNTIVKNAIIFIKNNYKNEIKVPDIASHVGVSVNYFQAVFKKAMGITPNNFIIKIRLEQAVQLLIMTKLPIGEVGFECGFLDNVYFSYVFKKYYKMTPNEFRNRNI